MEMRIVLKYYLDLKRGMDNEYSTTFKIVKVLIQRGKSVAKNIAHGKS